MVKVTVTKKDSKICVKAAFPNKEWGKFNFDDNYLKMETRATNDAILKNLLTIVDPAIKRCKETFDFKALITEIEAGFKTL